MEDQYKGKDWLLCTLVEFVTMDRTRKIPITLSISGGIMTGVMVSGSVFFERIGKLFPDGVSYGTDGEYKFGKLGEELYPEGETPENDGPPSYIHLEDARFISSSNQIPNNFEKSFWRGRLSEVSGFLMGSLDLNQE